MSKQTVKGFASIPSTRRIRGIRSLEGEIRPLKCGKEIEKHTKTNKPPVIYFCFMSRSFLPEVKILTFPTFLFSRLRSCKGTRRSGSLDMDFLLYSVELMADKGERPCTCVIAKGLSLSYGSEIEICSFA